jgi:hypothetical protein
MFLLGANSSSIDVGFAREVLAPKLGTNGAGGGLAEPSPTQLATAFGWWAPGSLASSCLMGPGCIELF